MFHLQASLILFLLFAGIKFDSTVTTHVHAIELNHFYDMKGNPVYDQVIFWECAPETGRFQVRAWTIADDREIPNRRPIKNYATGLYQVDWYDTDKGIKRKVTSNLYRESWTQYDPEMRDKKVHHESRRIPLPGRNPKRDDNGDAVPPLVPPVLNYEDPV